MGKIVEVIMARGHPRVTAKHQTTLMITKDREVGPKGDCIIGVAADKAAAKLSDGLKSAVRLGGAVNITIEAGGETDKIHARGHPSLTLTHHKDLVVRKSMFVCGRTLAVNADKAAADLSKTLVSKLCNPSTEVKLTIEVEQ